jgi:predicted acetyltransferase
MRTTLACLLAPLLIFAVPGVAQGSNVCDRLQIGNSVKAPNEFPVKASVLVPDISELPIQIRTTRPVSDTGEGRTHKCKIAHDLSEVDRMMKDVGFDGYPTNDTTPLFTNTAVWSIDDQDIETVRDVVRALYDPSGDVESAIASLQGNSDLFTASVLNVYYVHIEDDVVDYASAFTGAHLRDENGNSAKMIFISDGAKSDTVAHEFAHAFSAGHVNFWDRDGEEYCIKFLPHPGTDAPQINMVCEFESTNYMWAASKSDRQTLRDSQKERMLRNEHSIIYEYSPPENSIQCPEFKSDPDAGCTRMGE